MTAFPFYHQHDTMQCGGIIGDRFTSVPVPMTPQKPMTLANVVAKVRNINETVKLFGNFLSFNNFIYFFIGVIPHLSFGLFYRSVRHCLSAIHIIHQSIG